MRKPLNKLGMYMIASFSLTLCLADVTDFSAVTGSGANISFTSSTTANFTPFPDGPYGTSIISDTLTSKSSQINFTYGGSTDFTINNVSGDRLIMEVTNGTGSTLSNFVFTLSNTALQTATNPQYYTQSTVPPGYFIPSEGTYISGSPGTYTTTSSLFGGVNSGKTVLTVPVLTLAPGATQDFYFAINYTAGAGDFTLNQSATPEPSFYGVLALGLAGFALAVRRRA